MELREEHSLAASRGFDEKAMTTSGERRYHAWSRAREPERASGYWLLKGRSGCFYDCARFKAPRYTALCVFDSREAAEENARGLDEDHLFLNTLELYGSRLPECVRQGPMLPEPVGVL